MTNFVVIATGPSLTKQQVNYAATRANVVAVSDAYKLLPWAKALVSADAAWWKYHKEAQTFGARRFGIIHDFNNVPNVEKFTAPNGTNSGLLGIMVAVHLGAKNVYLIGFDLHSPGSHFFGAHPKPLKSTPSGRMEVFKKQFKNYQPRDVHITNCTPGSALDCYPMRILEECFPQ